MIGYQKKFVFVHIPKTAGQSVSKVLRPLALRPDQRAAQWLGRQAGRDLFQVREDHSTASEIRDALGPKRFGAFYSFAFVRNPWDRVQSIYRFSSQHPKRDLYDLAVSNDLEGFVERLAERGVRTQSHFVTDATGAVIVDFIGRFETLSRDFSHICDRLGIQSPLPHKNASGKGRYRSAFTPRAVDIVAELFADDVERFGYGFE